MVEPSNVAVGASGDGDGHPSVARVDFGPDVIDQLELLAEAVGELVDEGHRVVGEVTGRGRPKLD